MRIRTKIGLLRFMSRNSACEVAFTFVRNSKAKTLEGLLKGCTRPEWLYWLIVHSGYDGPYICSVDTCSLCADSRKMLKPLVRKHIMGIPNKRVDKWEAENA